jgi:putative sterol carrier protein
MVDTPARQRQLVGSSAAWVANNIVLGNGEIGVEVVTSSDVRMKVGDGTSTFSALPYASASSTTINTATQTALDAKLALAGGTMTGLLVLSGSPTLASHATTKAYVDAADAALSTSISGKLSTTGGTLTGALTLSGSPSSAQHATPKTYVDTADALKVTKSGDTMSGFLTLNADPTSALHAATKQYVDGGAYQTVVGGSATYAGKVLKLNSTGQIDTSVLPSGASYLGTVDMTLAYGLSTVATGSYYTVQTSGTIAGTWATHLNGSPTTCGAGQFLYQNANGKFDLVGDTTLSSSLSGKLDKTGGTMTGALILAADPTVALGAATKQYADTMLPKAGGTMTGAITLAADPAAALQPATKQYVDNAGSTLTTNYTAADTALSGTLTTSINAKVAKAGDTMTGFLTLSAAPTATLHAATKGYVDTAVTGLAVRANNLSDLASASTARTNLGLGSLATLSSAAYSNIQNVSATSRILGRKTAGAGVIEELQLTELLDFIGSAAQGDILYRGATTWARLPAGTAGQVLQTGGAAANPSWVTVASGGVTQLSTLTLSSGGGGTQGVTGIPSTAKVIFIGLSGVTNASGTTTQVQLGTSGGYVTTGYNSHAMYIKDATAGQLLTGTVGFILPTSINLQTLRGVITLMNIGGTSWSASYSLGIAGGGGAGPWVGSGGGIVDVGGTLDRIALNSTSGNFSAGTMTISYA